MHGIFQISATSIMWALRDLREMMVFCTFYTFLVLSQINMHSERQTCIQILGVLRIEYRSLFNLYYYYYYFWDYKYIPWVINLLKVPKIAYILIFFLVFLSHASVFLISLLVSLDKDKLMCRNSSGASEEPQPRPILNAHPCKPYWRFAKATGTLYTKSRD